MIPLPLLDPAALTAFALNVLLVVTVVSLLVRHFCRRAIVRICVKTLVWVRCGCLLH